MKVNNDIDYLSIRQFVQLTGSSYRSVMNYLNSGKVKYVRVDSYRLIPCGEVDNFEKVRSKRKLHNTLDGYKTILQASKILNIRPQSIKKYITNGRMPHVKHKNVYFIPDKVIDEWSKIDNADPNKVEAKQMDAMTIQQAGLALGCSDSRIRKLVAEGALTDVQGYNRRYVTNKSISDYKAVMKIAESL